MDLSQPRPSLSPSKFPDDAFVSFQDEHDHLGSEADVMRKIIPVICGDANIPNSGDALFNNLQSITNGDTVNAKPDFYDGARFDDIDKKVRDELDRLIIPTKSARRPAAPNFFLEAKDPEGGAGTAKRQAGLDGAIGARAMNALRNYGEGEPGFDGNAYSMSSTYHAGTGTLQLYSHHITAPTTLGGQPEYHMMKLRGFDMTDSRETFVQGATAFRNARDLAKRNRDQLILAANARARRSDADAPAEIETAVTAAGEDEASDGSADYRDNAGPQAAGSGTLVVIPTCVEGPVDSTSLTPGVTSSFSTPGRNASKRPRPPQSPPSDPGAQKQNLAKTRTRNIS